MSDAASTCSNLTETASARFVPEAVSGDVMFSAAVGFCAFVAAAAMVYAMVVLSKRRRAQSKIAVFEIEVKESKIEIMKQKNDIARLKSSKHNLELRFLPTTKEEKLFRPFREKLHKIVGDAFLASDEFETVRTLAGRGYSYQ